MRSIKTKLIVALSVLLLFLFGVTAYLLVDEKTKELSHDIYRNARSFSELSTPKIIDLYTSLLKERSFFIFNREISDVFSKNTDVTAIKVYSFSGEILYDSEQEQERQYEGDERHLEDNEVRTRLKSNLPSYLLASGRTVYIKKMDDGVYRAVDQNEKEVPEILDSDVLVNSIYPFEGKFAVQFDITYENLNARVLKTTQRIVLLLVFGLLVGLGAAWYFSERITVPIGKLTKGATIIAHGDFSTRVDVDTKDEVGMLADTFNKMAKDLQASTQAMLYKERVAKELEMASRIQRQILPTSVPHIQGLDVAACVIPAAEIGGDCYDFLRVDDDTHLFYISDVTGHGVPSGIVVSIANAIIYSYAHEPNLKDILINTNNVLKEKTAQNMFMTMLMLRYRAGVLNYVSAGHPEMLHYIGSESKVVAEKGGGIALGMVPDISKMVNESTISFNSGDCVILYSDGIPEANSPTGEQYGAERLKASLNLHATKKTAEEIKTGIIADVKNFMGNAQQLDDITLVVLKRT